MDQNEDVYTESEDENVDTDTDDGHSMGDLDYEMALSLSQMASSLCFTCRQFPRGRFPAEDSQTIGFHLYHPSLSSLKKSVDAGCRLCVELSQSLDKFRQRYPQAIQNESTWSINCRLGAWTTSLIYGFYLCDCDCDYISMAKLGRARCEHVHYLESISFCPAGKLGLGPEFLGAENDQNLSFATTHQSVPDPTLKMSSAKSATSFAVARSWYEQCLNHSTCREWRQERRVLPTRLIQIWRPDKQSSDLSARICKTNDLPTNTSYVALSHCWGKGVTFKLLHSNLEELSRVIPIWQLSKVFQDAIQVAFEIGIGYIWIDSLCIIQDSEEDWSHEAKRMGDVYSNGEFNIAATGYEDGLAGLFSERKALSLVHIPLHVECVLVDARRKMEEAIEGIYVRAQVEEFFWEVSSGPLNDRAWVAQERALSPAVLHYTPNKIYWECNKTVASEAFLNGSYVWKNTEGGVPDRIRSLIRGSEREKVYSFWRTFISSYAGMRITLNQDRFPALAGIARLVGELIEDNLVAGFWEGDLARSLVMERHVPTIDCIPPEQLAPSWSWASLCADNSVPCRDESLFEPLKGTHFRVLSDIPGFKSDLQSPSFEKSGVRALAIKGVLRKLLKDFDKHPEWIESTALIRENEDAVKFLWGKLPGDQQWRLKSPTHMLLLARESNEWDSAVDIYGLLLHFADAHEPNTFHRSGTIRLGFHNDEKGDEFLGLREKDGKYEPSLFFEERGLQDLVLL